MRRSIIFLLAGACVLQPLLAPAQGLTRALIGTVKDAQGGVLAGAVVRVSSPALIGGPETLTTNEKGHLRFPALPPNFGQGTVFMDPRRAMAGVRLNLGR